MIFQKLFQRIKTNNNPTKKYQKTTINTEGRPELLTNKHKIHFRYHLTIIFHNNKQMSFNS